MTAPIEPLLRYLHRLTARHGWHRQPCKQPRRSRAAIAATVLALAESGATSTAMAKAKAALALLLSLGLAAGAGALGYPVPTEFPPEANQAEQPQSTKPEKAKRSGTDLYGDPLPPGALMRLGTLRFRVSSFFSGGQQDLPDQRTKLIYREDAILWCDAASGKEIDRWNLPQGMKIKGVARDGKCALLFDGSTLHVWDTASRKCIRTLDCKSERKDEQTYGFFSADGRILVTHHGFSHNPGLIRVWDMATGKELWHEGAATGRFGDGISPLGFSDDGRTLIVQHNKDNIFSLLDLRTGKAQRSFSTMPTNDSRQYGLSPDGRTVMIGTAGQAVRSWDAASGKENPPLGGHKGQAHRFAFSNDSKSVATGGEDSFVQVWDWPLGRLRRRIDLGSGSVETIRFTPDGQRLEVVIQGELALRYWDVKTGRELPAAADGHRGLVCGVAFLPNGEIASTAMDNTVRVWDAASGRTLRQFPTHLQFGASKFSVSSDGKTLAVADGNRPDIQLLDAASGRKLVTLKTFLDNCTCIAFSPAGKYLASTSHPSQPTDNRSTVQLWDAATGQEVRRVGDEFCGRLAFSPNGHFLAIKHGDRIGIWRVATGARYRSIGLKDSRGLAFSPDGRMLATGSPEGGIALWEVATAKKRLHLKPPDSWSEVVRFAPDGRYLATTGGDTKTIYLWDARTGELVHRFTGHEAWPETLAFSGDGRVLASSSFDTTILLWDAAAVTAKRRTPAAKLSAKEIETHWDALADADATAAYRAIWAFAASPREASVFLRRHLHRVEPVEIKKIEKMVLDLDSDSFAARERAAKELAKLDRLAKPALEKALTHQPSLEMRRRVQQLLEQLDSAPSGDQLRQMRAIEALEHIGTIEARQVLETLAGGAAEARLTHEAKESLARLAARHD